MNKKEILSEIKKIEIVIRKRLSGNSAGFYISAYKGNGVELEGIKEYSDEDDFRLIDWNAFARTGRPYTLVMQEERELELYLIVDVSESMGGGGSLYPARKTKLETAAVAAAVLGLSAASSRDRTAAILFSGKVEETVMPASGRGHIFSIAEKIIDSIPMCEGSNLEAACRALPKSFRKKGICIIISDMEYDMPWQTLLQISSRAETAIFRIRDNLGSSFSATIEPEIENRNFFSYESEGMDPCGYFYLKRKKRGRISSGNMPLVGISSVGISSSIENSDKDFSEATKFNIPLVDISTSDNIVEKINTFFKLRKR
ncbi:MAG: DUF58 domain-containing protein [Spirochaetaceae bacterium]|nr:DUF58 domain-containing protein [Spirochaetaceae bacterium]